MLSLVLRDVILASPTALGLKLMEEACGEGVYYPKVLELSWPSCVLQHSTSTLCSLVT